jgi:hypothetical protein
MKSARITILMSVEYSPQPTPAASQRTSGPRVRVNGVSHDRHPVPDDTRDADVSAVHGPCLDGVTPSGDSDRVPGMDGVA